MPPNWKLIIVMPAFNQAKTLPPLLQNISNLKIEGAMISTVIVVDDASTDNTFKTMSSMRGLNLTCLRELKNVGPSDAILDGFKEAKKSAKHEKNVIIVRMDSDGDHNPKDISKLIAPIVAGKANAAVIDTSYGLSNGLIDLVYNRIFGFIQGKVLSGGSFSQVSPGFYAFRSIYLEKFIKFRTNYVNAYARHFKQKDRYGIDLSFLAFFHNSIVVIRHNAKPLQRGRRPLAKIYAQGREMLKHFKIVKKLKNR